MKYRPRVKKPVIKAPPGTVSTVHPVDVPRAATGSKGDAWVVSLPSTDPEPGVAVLAFDTGRDSTTIVIGDVHGPTPRMHPAHDLGIVIPAGSGELRQGPGPADLVTERWTGPTTLVIPAGVWHAVIPDAGSGRLTAFFTRPGQTIDPFSIVGPRAEPGMVHLDTLPVSPWPMAPARVVAEVAGAGAAVASGSGAWRPAPRPDRRGSSPYPAPVGDDYTLPLDTGTDTLFVMSSFNRSWDRAPVDVAVHRHDREDEYIVMLDASEGWLLNGPTQESVQRVPFRGPCVLVMPSGNFHRVVRTEEIQVLSILVYAHRSQVTGTWADIVAEMELGEVTE